MDNVGVILKTIQQNMAVIMCFVTIILAFLGYMATYINTRMVVQKKDRLELVTNRLNKFYGPLYVVTQAGKTAYSALVEKLGRENAVFEKGIDPSLAELEEWYLWMRTVFMPLNNQIERLIVENAYLIVERQMPKCLLCFVTHVVGYKAALAKWERGDFSERFPLVNFPIDLDDYATQSYNKLKSEQARLLEAL